MTEQLDFIFFFYGFCFVALGANCFLARKKRSPLPWTWLGFFGLIHGLNRWLEMLALSVGDSGSFKAVRICAMALSFICLVEFGRLGAKSLAGKGPGRWVTLALLVIGCTGWLHGWVGLNALLRYSLGMAGGIWSAAALLLARRRSENPGERRSLLALGILLAAHSAAMCPVVSPTPFLPASMPNELGVTIQLFRGILALASAICVWQAVGLHQMRQTYRIAFACALLLILACGWLVTNCIGEREHREWICNLQSACTISAASLNSELVKNIDFNEHVRNPQYELLKERLIRMRQTSTEWRWIYAMVVRGNKIIFSADSEPTTSKDYSPPGDEYRDAPAELRALCRGEGRVATAQYQDKWGRWDSVFVPARNDATGKPVAILGMDCAQETIGRAVCSQRLHVIAVTFLVLFITILLFYLRERQELYIAHISEARDALQEKEEHLSCTLHSIADAVIATDCDCRITRMNRVAEVLTGWAAANAVGRPVSDVLHIISAKTGEPAYNPIPQVLASGKIAEIANGTIIISRNGGQRQIADSCSPIRSADGGIIGAVLVFSDVTERYRIQKELRESEGHYRGLFEHMAEGYAHCKMIFENGEPVDFIYLCVNTAFETLSGLSNVTGKRVSEVIPGIRESSPELFAIYARVCLTGKPEKFEDFTEALNMWRSVAVYSAGNGCFVSVFEVITERKQAEEALQNEKDNLAAIFASSPVGLLLLDEETTVVDTNDVVARFLSRTREEIIGKRGGSALGCVHSLENEGLCSYTSACAQCPLRTGVTQVLKNGESIRGVEIQATLMVNGREVHPWLSVSAEPVTINGRRHVIFAIHDITDRKASESKLVDSEQRYRMLWESASDGFALHEMVMDSDGNAINYRILDVNPVYESVIGVKASDVVGKLATEAYDTAEPPYLELYARVALTGVSEHFETLFRRMGRHFSISVFSPSPGQFATAFTDISERKTYEHVLAHQASHDTLTGLPNRNCFEQQLGDLIKSCSAKQRRTITVLFLDLDKFKLINDTLGHKVGDLLLIEVAERLESCIRSGDLLARMGGDEFTVILPRGARRATVETIVSRVIDSISRPFEIQGHKFVIGASIGLASYPSDGKDSVTLLKHADAAMYKAKQSGRGTFCWYSGDVDVENQQRADMEMDIRAALEKGQFNVHYQPIVDLVNGDILAAEALLRWEHPEKGTISPSLFIPIAEEIGLISRIGDYVLRTACAQTMAWRDEGIYLSQIGVNVSIAQMRKAGWLDSVTAAISDTGLDAECLNLELTETAFADSDEPLGQTLRKVQELGICMAIDDFGIGQSSLSRLKDFPVIHLKIDGSFVREIEHRKIDSALVGSIIEMAHGQGIKVTAEWVETESQMEILRSIGCDFAQGYFISPALNAKAFADFIRKWGLTRREADAA